MEDKNFQWLTRLLVSNKSRLSLLETIFFHAGVLDLWIYTDDSGIVRKRSAGEDGVVSFAEAIAYFVGKARKNARRPGQNQIACYTMWKGERMTMDIVQGEELTGKKDACPRSSFIQEFKDLRGPKKAIYTYCTKYSPKGYSSASYRLRDGFKQKETSNRMLHKMRDVCLILISAVEHVKLRRVMDLELEFMVDEGGALWLMGSPKCRVAIPALCHSDLTRFSDLPSESTSPKPHKAKFLKQKTKTFEKDDEATKVTLQEQKYLFKRGQLRNQRSNLGSPIRIHSPVSSRESRSEEEQSPEGSDKTIFEALTSKTVLTALFRPCKADKFNNSNFQEMLMRTFVKRTGLSPRATDNQEELHKYMESVLFPSEPDVIPRSYSIMNKFRLSVFRNEDLSPTISGNGNVSESSDSEDSAEEVVRPKLTDPEKLPSLQSPRRSKFSRIRSMKKPISPGLTSSRSDATFRFKCVKELKPASSLESFDLRIGRIRGPYTHYYLIPEIRPDSLLIDRRIKGLDSQ